MPEIRVIRETKVLRCLLTTTEKLNRGQKVAELTYAIAGLEDEKKASADHFKGKISEAEDMRKRLSGVLRDGYELRPVECEIHHDFYTKTVYAVRTDTGEVVDTRPMREEEIFRQGRLFPEPEKSPTILPAEEPPRSPESIGREAEEPATDSGSVNENPPDVNAEAESVNAGRVAVDSEEPATDAPTQEEREEMLAPDEDPGGLDAADFPPDAYRTDVPELCATCAHAELVHGDERHGSGSAACMATDCRCRRFVPPDPLGINDVDPQAREGSDA